MGWADKVIQSITIVDFVVIVVILFLVLLLCLRRRGWSIKKVASSDHMPGYVLIYADQKGNTKGDSDFGKLLYSAEYQLQGKPDYIFRKRFGRGLVPMELKSGMIGDSPVPHRGDLLQLGAYFLILEDVYKVRPKVGKLIYQDYMFLIKNTKNLRKEIQHTAKEMREMLVFGVAKANDSFANCRFCICNGTVCTHSATEIDGGKTNEGQEEKRETDGSSRSEE